jgi:AraC-like DNA-binding protein
MLARVGWGGTFRLDLGVLTVSLSRLRHWRVTRGGQPYWRLYWNPDPGAVVRLGGRQVPLEPGRVVLISPNTEFDGRHVGHPRHLWIHFVAGDPMDRLSGLVWPIEDLGPWRARLEALARRLAESRDVLDRPSQLETASLVTWALSHVPSDRWPKPTGDSRIENAVRAIRDEPGRAWTNAQLARRAHLAPNSFIRRFRQVMGVPPGEYLSRCRIDRASLMLAHSDESIEAIAEACGFCDRSYFSTVFRRRTGLSPARYRRLLR